MSNRIARRLKLVPTGEPNLQTALTKDGVVIAFRLPDGRQVTATLGPEQARLFAADMVRLADLHDAQANAAPEPAEDP